MQVNHCVHGLVGNRRFAGDSNNDPVHCAGHCAQGRAHLQRNLVRGDACVKGQHGVVLQGRCVHLVAEFVHGLLRRVFGELKEPGHDRGCRIE